ncbi:hypothetical protein ABC733_26545 [Mangrovibacter sp. SLW1]
MAAFYTLPPSRLRRAMRARPHETTNALTAAITTPSRRAQAVFFTVTHHRWRAMLSPPRLPALWGGFDASA